MYKKIHVVQEQSSLKGTWENFRGRNQNKGGKHPLTSKKKKKGISCRMFFSLEEDQLGGYQMKLLQMSHWTFYH